MLVAILVTMQWVGSEPVKRTSDIVSLGECAVMGSHASTDRAGPSSFLPAMADLQDYRMGLIIPKILHYNSK